MKKDFKWSELEFLRTEEDVTLAEVLKSFGVTNEDFSVEELKDLTTFTEMDYTMVSGICQDCGNEYEWQGLFKDMPEDFCDCRGKR